MTRSTRSTPPPVAATRVGTSTAFGIGEIEPVGLASHGDDLYMLGFTNGWLYTLDTTTGAATRVGTSTAFGIGETLAERYRHRVQHARRLRDQRRHGEDHLHGRRGRARCAHSVCAGERWSGCGRHSGILTVDDIVRITVTVPNLEPSFARDAYDFGILPGTDGSSAAHTVGAVTATDSEGQALSYSLRASDPPSACTWWGPTTTRSTPSTARPVWPHGSVMRCFRCRYHRRSGVDMARGQALPGRRGCWCCRRGCC